MIAIGIGYTTSASADDILAAIAALKNVCSERPDTLATIKKFDTLAKFEMAAQTAGLSLQVFGRDVLQSRADDCVSQSLRSLAAYGVGSVAEAAALVASGPGSRCIVPRISLARVTIAAAKSCERSGDQA